MPTCNGLGRGWGFPWRAVWSGISLSDGTPSSMPLGSVAIFALRYDSSGGMKPWRTASSQCPELVIAMASSPIEYVRASSSAESSSTDIL